MSSTDVRRHRPLHSSSKANQAGRVREVTRGGREYLVFPLIALREMVIDYPENGTRELLERERLHESSDLWAGTPLTYIHPENANGTADVPESFTRETIGQVFHPEIVDDEKLRVEAWLDVEKANSIGGLAEQVLNRLRDGDRLSISAGYRTFDDQFESGVHNGEEYDVKQGAIMPDHVAIFPSEEFTARCDWEDGCGAPRANFVSSDCGCSHQSRENLDGAGSAEESPVEPEFAEELIEFEHVDWFFSEEAAADRAEALGCSDVHTHETSTGRTVFMPCASHDDYVEILRSQAESRPRSDVAADRQNTGSKPADQMSTEQPEVDEEPATLFRRLLKSVGFDPDASQPGAVQANASAQTEEPVETDDADDDGADSTEEDATESDPAEEADGQDSEEATDTDDGDTSDDSTMTDDDPNDKENEMTLSVEDLAEHTMFSVETLEEMGDDILEQLEQDVIRELIGSGSAAQQEQQDQPERENADVESEATDEPEEGSHQEETVTNNTDIDTEQFVTEDELDDRLTEFEETVTNSFESTLEEQLDEVKSEKQNARDQENARIVANAIDGMSVEAAQELPSDELADLAEKHGGPRANFAAVPGQMDRTVENAEENPEYEEYPAGGRSEWKQRKEGE